MVVILNPVTVGQRTAHRAGGGVGPHREVDGVGTVPHERHGGIERWATVGWVELRESRQLCGVGPLGLIERTIDRNGRVEPGNPHRGVAVAAAVHLWRAHLRSWTLCRRRGRLSRYPGRLNGERRKKRQREGSEATRTEDVEPNRHHDLPIKGRERTSMYNLRPAPIQRRKPTRRCGGFCVLPPTPRPPASRFHGRPLPASAAVSCPARRCTPAPSDRVRPPLPPDRRR